MSTPNTNNASDQDGIGDLIPHATTLAIGEECGCWGYEPIDDCPPLEDGSLGVTTLALGEEGGHCDIWSY